MPGLLKVQQSSDEEDDVRSSSTMSIISGTSTRRSSVSSISRSLSGALSRSSSILGKLKRTRSKASEPESRYRKPRIVMNEEIHQAILNGLEMAHKAEGTCYTCLGRDLVAYASVCKDFREVGLKRLYSSVFIHGDECLRHKSHSSKTMPASRLKKLRYTLETRPDYAEWILQLKVPEFRRDLPTSKLTDQQIEIGEVVSLCPNLEKLLGAQYPLEIMSDGLLYALRNCKNLREHLWLLSSGSEAKPRALPDAFESFHGSWTQLQTLVIAGDGTSCISEGSIVRALKKLPSLQRLMFAHLPKSAFTDASLREFPATVRALRLERLEGVTDLGLLSLGRNRNSLGIECLALIGLPLERFSTISTLISGMKRLCRFTLEHDATNFKDASTFALQSESLVYMHWDLRRPKSSSLDRIGTDSQPAQIVVAANGLLATAIGTGKFPKLTKLRAPSDDGQLQKVCKPRWNIARPTDFVFEFSAKDPLATDPSTASFLPRHQLREARRRAEERAEQAGMKMPMFTINIEEDGDVKTSQIIRDRSLAVGNGSSKVYYDLDPDFEGGFPTAESSAFVGLDEILGQWRLETEPQRYCAGVKGEGFTMKKSRRGGHAGGLGHQERSSFYTLCQLGNLFGTTD
ncbi:hypothetical protein BJ508DRAFT_56632 [Ascobolus immersus RN42]|uniref:Uncharacterized protein n=1 Tax=Ascobolus immersus RN42 TaxID=1160509 RepID=A0A3N4IHP8_ASCIM|nr:hypothetical protein BJ508DRAFT_56632 [Ascobolus immersus RN42]